jgi:hypothetical protein
MEDERLDWEYHSKRFVEINGFDVFQNQEIKEGLNTFREMFDDEWLAMNINNRHPLCWRINNYDLASYMYLSDLGHKINLLKKVEKFSGIIARLKKENEYEGSEAELDTAYRLISTGIRVIEFSPKIDKKGKEGKRADIKTSVNDEEIIFEVTTLRDSKNTTNASKNFDDLDNPFKFNRDFIVYYQIHKILSKPHVNELRDKITKAFDKVKETGEYCYIGEPGVIDYIIIPHNKKEQIENIANKYGMKREVSGASVPIDVERRLENKIWEKEDQLPQDKLGVIVIYANLFYINDPKKYYNDLAFQIEETVFEQSNLLLLILIGRSKFFATGFHMEENNRVVLMKEKEHSVYETIIIIKNRYSTYNLGEGVIEKIASAFEKI